MICKQIVTMLHFKPVKAHFFFCTQLNGFKHSVQHQQLYLFTVKIIDISGLSTFVGKLKPNPIFKYLYIHT